jgi:large subunit ribosomal protein L15
MVNIISIKGKSGKRPGRGISAGQGKTAGRGTKGQKSRAGYDLPNRFEGGQTPLGMRLPKLPGFKSKGHKAEVITLSDISRKFKNGEIVSEETLIAKQLIKKGEKAKILNTGKLEVKVTLDPMIATSKSVRGLFESTKPIAEIKTPVKKPVVEKKTQSKITPPNVKPSPKKSVKKIDKIV